ncbi:nucleolar protein 4-like [Watersipora subatra]|uniref:nucleolar protein 4-like n=1 Tax=Watersipora subatra TaxID=2589382 RepID=UPI00355C7B8A
MAHSFDNYKKWIHTTFGEGSRAKTITWSKYLRIHKVLSGRSLGERPKFKFWVKSKGFCFLKRYPLTGRQSEIAGVVIALPNKKTSGESMYRRVAVVEEFFDIIHSIHIGMGERNGTHAGQKRTYKAIMESYACLPREAVTHFLMNCEPCCSRMRLSLSPGIPECNSRLLDSSVLSLPSYADCSSPESYVDIESANEIFYVTACCFFNTILELSKISMAEEKSVSSEEVSVIEKESKLNSEMKAHTVSPDTENEIEVDIKEEPNKDMAAKLKALAGENEEIEAKETQLGNRLVISEEKLIKHIPRVSTPLKRSAEVNHAISPKSSKKGSDDGEDDDDEDDDNLSMSPTEVDPERLKAFNMFCRLFVDENLDRLIPISKQPKEKLQSILDACNRQFPEFQERSRKRVRTYLKSCRRMRRARNMDGLESQIRPTPPHLTSPIAENLLSQACENEMENSSRIKMGLEPLPSTPVARRLVNHTTANSVAPTPNHASSAVSMPTLAQAVSRQQASAQPVPGHRILPDWRFQHTAPFRHDLTPFFGSGFFRPPFPGLPTPVPSAAAPIQVSQAANLINLQPAPPAGVTADLSALKKQASAVLSTQNKASILTATEKATIKQLITGYRESATFLYKSADELELLIAHTG